MWSIRSYLDTNNTVYVCTYLYVLTVLWRNQLCLRKKIRRFTLHYSVSSVIYICIHHHHCMHMYVSLMCDTCSATGGNFTSVCSPIYQYVTKRDRSAYKCISVWAWYNSYEYFAERIVRDKCEHRLNRVNWSRILMHFKGIKKCMMKKPKRSWKFRFRFNYRLWLHLFLNSIRVIFIFLFFFSIRYSFFLFFLLSKHFIFREKLCVTRSPGCQTQKYTKIYLVLLFSFI